MRFPALVLRLLAAACAAMAAGCINLPPSVERELACPPAGADTHFGDAGPCAPHAGS
jgi:hypothetical protein